MSDSDVKKPAKRIRKSISLLKKMEVITRMEAGETRASVCRALNLATATVSTIMNNSKKIKETVLKTKNLHATIVSYSRSTAMEKMEELLALWLDDINQKNIPISQSTIADKAKSLFDEIQQREGGTEVFTASKGWFTRFKHRSQIFNVKISGQSPDVEAARAFPEIFKKIVADCDVPPDLVFNVAETCLYWKEMPANTHSEKTEMGAAHKVVKDRLTLLFCGNATGTMKLKPLLVYHSVTPRVLKGLINKDLPVTWKANKNAWVTQAIMTEWYTKQFCTSVLRFCDEYNLPHKVLLLLDMTLGPLISVDKIKSDLTVKVVYLPLNTTSLLQPLDQGVMTAFKVFYLREIFLEIVQQIDEFGITLKEYWKDYNILKAVENISTAWKSVSITCMNTVWSKLWPDCVNEYKDFEQMEMVTNEISRLAQEAGIDKMEPKDIIAHLDSHAQPLSNAELEEMAKQRAEQQKKQEDSVKKPIKTADLQNILGSINKALQRLSEIDPDSSRSSSVKQGVHASLHPYFEIIRHRRRKPKLINPSQCFETNEEDCILRKTLLSKQL